ncbi:MAG: hypothetical protein GF331_05965 [Chitinivibrionales bacterium]|nr:hypothetical protein [Chitinivibrionales bacterium]
MFVHKPPNPVRTIYHNTYDLGKSSMSISFYRGDSDGGELRTGDFEFAL